MNFSDLAKIRQSCRSFDPTKEVEKEKLSAILKTASLAPSARNSQLYRVTVCQGEIKKQVEKETQELGMNLFASDAPLLLVISLLPKIPSAGDLKRGRQTDFREIDIGILSAYICLEATQQGLSTCILGWLNEENIQNILHLEEPVRLVIALGYAKEGDPLRQKKRKQDEEWLRFVK